MNPIRHIEFWVSNLEHSLEFYKELFSAISWSHVDENGFLKDGVKIYFYERADLNGNIKVPGPRHICFQADNKKVVDLVANLPKVKDKILHGPDTLHPNGSYMLVFRDPDGYILEVAYKE